MKKWSLRILLILIVVTSFLVFVRRYSVLNSAELDSRVRRELPLGSGKAEVVSFIKERHPLFYDDYGKEVKARFTGLADNMIYKKDVILTFEFNAEGKLTSYFMKVSLTFL